MMGTLSLMKDMIIQRNELRQKVFFIPKSLAEQMVLLDLYDDINQRYLYNLHLLFMDNTTTVLFDELLQSTDAYDRYFGLTLMNDGFPNQDFLSNHLKSILDFSINGNDQEHVLSLKIIKTKIQSSEHLQLIVQYIKNILYSLDILYEKDQDFYYFYLNLKVLIIQINSKQLIKLFLEWSDKYSNLGVENKHDQEMKEVYEDMRQMLG